MPPRSDRFFDQALVRFLLRHCLDGVVAGWALLIGLLWTDVGRVRTLIYASEVGWLALIMLAVAFAITFGSVGMGIAVNRLGRSRRSGRDGEG
jgi:hypothetical protein